MGGPSADDSPGARLGVRWKTAWALGVASVALVSAWSCGGSSPATVALAQACSINSDCDSPLICAFERCHNACTQSRDCPAGERCVSAGADSVCELPIDDVCGAASLCPSGLVCAGQQCRNACSTAEPCTVGQQSCISGACFDLSEVSDAGAADAGITPYGPGGDAAADVSADGSSVPPWFPNADAGPLGFVPSNLAPPAASVDAGGDGGDAGGLLASGPDAFISQTCTNCLPSPPTTITLNDGSFADLYVLESLVIEQTAALRLSGPRPIVLLVLTTVDIQGFLLVNGVGETPGPGGFASGANPGPGAGSSGAAYPNSLGGGASFCGSGGAGGAAAPPAAPGGATYGNAALTPLVGGSAGAGQGYGGSAGGGAIQIVAGTSITVRAYGLIDASGGGGQDNTWGGGGSGGAILLEAPAVVVDGNVVANGGGGSGDGIAAPNGGDGTDDDQPASGGGAGGNGSAGASVNGADGADLVDAGGSLGAVGGGAGRIRINTATGQATVTGILSPSLGSSPAGGAACATEGTLGE